MARKLLVALSVLALAGGLAACTEIEEPPTPAGKLVSAINPFTDAIPREYGRLVGVSPLGDRRNALWFEKEDKTIVVVGVNWTERQMFQEIAVIPRK